MRAKNVAQKLTRNLEASVSRDKLLVLIGLAELPCRAVEALGNLLGGNHLPPVRDLVAVKTNLKYLAGKDLTSSKLSELAADLEQLVPL